MKIGILLFYQKAVVLLTKTEFSKPVFGNDHENLVTVNWSGVSCVVRKQKQSDSILEPLLCMSQPGSQTLKPLLCTFLE